MKYLLLLTLAVMVGGCSKGIQRPRKYKLSSGKEIFCQGFYPDRCGLNLYDCSDGQDYYCQVNAEPIPLDSSIATTYTAKP